MEQNFTVCTWWFQPWKCRLFQCKSCSTINIHFLLSLTVLLFSCQRGVSHPPPLLLLPLFLSSSWFCLLISLLLILPPPLSPCYLSPPPHPVSTFLSTSQVFSTGNSVWDQGSTVVLHISSLLWLTENLHCSCMRDCTEEISHVQSFLSSRKDGIVVVLVYILSDSCIIFILL